MEAKLKVIDGAKEKTIKLKLPMTIGRSEEATLKVPQSQVSRKHCEIYAEDGMLVVDDLGSSNGTFINGERITEPTFLYPGESLRIGKVTFEAEYEPPPEFELGEESAEENPASAKTVVAVSPSSLTDEEIILDDPPAETSSESESSSESVLNYSENSEGSFLGIDEIETGQEASPQASSLGELETGSAEDGKVDPGDSSLNDFFKNLE